MSTGASELPLRRFIRNKGSCAPCKHAVHSDGCIVLTGNLSGGCHQ